MIESQENYLTLQQEFSELSEKAIALVRHGSSPKLIKGYYNSFLFQIVYDCSLHHKPTVGWQVYRRQRRDSGSPTTHVGVRTEWVSLTDVEKFQTPVERLKYPLPRVEPTVLRREFEVIVEELWSRVSSLGLPLLLPETGIGLDGETYELKCGGYMANLSIGWWGDGPREWQPFIREVLKLYESLEAQCVGRGSEI